MEDEANEITIEVNNNNDIVFGKKCDIKITKNINKDDKYIAQVFCDNIEMSTFEINENITKAEIELNKEGKKNISVKVYKNTDLICLQEKVIYSVNEYEYQFAEEISQFGISTHFGLNYNRDEIPKGLELLYNLGIKNIRDTILWEHVGGDDGVYDYTIPDSWIPYIQEKKINILALVGGGNKFQMGDDLQISTNKELQKYKHYIIDVFNKYPTIMEYQIFNEPNDEWASEEQKEWYAKTVILTDKELKINNELKRTNVGSVAIQYQKEKEAIDYLNDIVTKYGAYKYSNTLSYHMYSSQEDMERLKQINKYANEMINNIGGFTNININEFGIKSDYESTSEEEQAKKIIKQFLTYIKNGVSKAYLYVFRDITKEDETLKYGLINNDYTPKKSYYIMKRFITITNGAEYIGTLNNLEGVENTNLEAHVYDKDGKAKIIVWSNNSDETITIPYSNFKATDLYGNEIRPNEEGNLVITTSPIYLDDVEYSYFYQAISNVAIEKYDQFTEKFASEMTQVSELSSKIEENKNYMKSVGQVQTRVVGTSSIQAMKNHFDLGNIILQAYKDRTLQTEDVKISSMLDMLNDIGDSYEDLVTVSAQTVVESDIEQTNTAIQRAEKTINNNQGAEIIYPVKILEFAKEHYEKATYINGLEEENDIKDGLIISNNLHALLLANWANTFAQINIDNYVDEYIANNPVTIEYSTTELTNQNVKATIKTDTEIQITNNSNSKEHTFEQNGSFTFEYIIKGRALKITAKVENIDKVAPTISGIQNGKLYTEPVTPKVNDDNLQSIELKLNSQVVSNYENGDTLEEEGFYEITAKDKAGNIVARYFQIFINTDTNYKIEENYIKNVTNNTKKSDFDEKINLSVDYKITRNEEEISQDGILATGDILTTETGDEYIIIITGDINKDGKVDLKDFIKMRIYLLLENNLDDIEKVAADCNLDGQVIGVKDYIKMRLIILTNDVTN